MSELTIDDKGKHYDDITGQPIIWSRWICTRRKVKYNRCHKYKYRQSAHKIPKNCCYNMSLRPENLHIIGEYEVETINDKVNFW